eukprot:269603-Prymnesium_polylepis.1
MAAAETEPAAARSADRAALERLAFCRLLGEGDVLRGLNVLLDREAAAARAQGCRHNRRGGRGHGAARGGGDGRHR